MNRLIIIANATAASAAAKTITNIVKTWPSITLNLEVNLLNAIKLIFAELSINSIPISIATAFCLEITAYIPKENKKLDIKRYNWRIYWR